MGANDPAHYQRHDYLEDLVYLEDMFHTLGYEDGLRDGVKAGRLDGREFGAQKAFDLGQELGYYMGSARVWLSSLEQLPDLSKNPPRTIKHLQDLMILIAAFPRANHPDIDFFLQLDRIRAKFKLVMVSVNATQRYAGSSQMAKKMSY